MGFFSTISDMFSTPESKINKLASLIRSATSKNVSDDIALQKLKVAAQNHFSADMRSKMLIGQLREGNREASSIDLKCIFIVALCDSILALMGENTMPYSQRSNLPDGHEETLNMSCQMQKGIISMASIDQEALRDVLWQSFGIKVAWKSLKHPCWKTCRITDAEIWARNEYLKAHPRPK